LDGCQRLGLPLRGFWGGGFGAVAFFRIARLVGFASSEGGQRDGKKNQTQQQSFCVSVFHRVFSFFRQNRRQMCGILR
jgi:hypothetical protein